jgi:hypothetical protein
MRYVQKIKRDIFKFGLEDELELIDCDASYGIELRRRDNKAVMDFENEFYTRLPVIEVIRTIFENPEVKMDELCRNLGISEKMTRKKISSFDHECQKLGFHLSMRKFHFLGWEFEIREEMVQFFLRFGRGNGKNEFHKEEEIRKLVRKSLDILNVGIISKELFDEMCVRFGVALMRIRQSRNVFKLYHLPEILQENPFLEIQYQSFRELFMIYQLQEKNIYDLMMVFYQKMEIVDEIGGVALSGLPQKLTMEVQESVPGLMLNDDPKWMKRLSYFHLNLLLFGRMAIVEREIKSMHEEHAMEYKKFLTVTRDVLYFGNIQMLRPHTLASSYTLLFLKYHLSGEKIKVRFGRFQSLIDKERVKGVIETTFKERFPMKVLAEEDADEEDFIIEGKVGARNEFAVDHAIFVEESLSYYDVKRVERAFIEEMNKKKILHERELNN